MKKTFILALFVTLIGIFSLGFTSKPTVSPHNYYEVYLDDKSLGIIKSKDELEDYINKNGDYYKKKYGVNKVYSPTNLKIKKITTYSDDVKSVKSIYKKIAKEADLTISGYEFTITKKIKDGDEEKIEKQKIYVLNKEDFKKAVQASIQTFTGKDRYKAYLDGNQVKITSTGENIENIYVDEGITFKKTNIPVKNKIYTDEKELASYLLYGDNYQSSEYTVNAGDTVNSVAFNNEVSPEEILLANPDLKSTSNLLYPGQKIKIAQTNPKLSVVEESYVVQDIESQYKTEEKTDESIVVGEERVDQEGENGMDRVSQRVKKVNGNIVYVDPVGKQVLKEPINKIVVKGSKVIPDVGSTSSWGWPTDSGYTLSSGYEWRTSPINGRRELHGGIDISGTGYGSKIYATNNGRVITASSHPSYGIHVVINHNNGYYTLYGHMSRLNVKVGQVVSRGDVIGFVGMTGAATGPHVHYEIWKGCQYCRLDPMTMYR